MKREVNFTVKYELPIPDDILNLMELADTMAKDDIMEYITFLMVVLSEKHCAENCIVEVKQK